MKTPFERALRCAPPAASIALVVACAACSTTGTAVGELEQPGSKREEAVTFVWKSDASDPDRGKISGTLPGCGAAWGAPPYRWGAPAPRESLFRAPPSPGIAFSDAW